MQYGDLEKYIHIISDNKHTVQTKIKKTKQQKTKNKKLSCFSICPWLIFFGYMMLEH